MFVRNFRLRRCATLFSPFCATPPRILPLRDGGAEQPRDENRRRKIAHAHAFGKRFFSVRVLRKCLFFSGFSVALGLQRTRGRERRRPAGHRGGCVPMLRFSLRMSALSVCFHQRKRTARGRDARAPPALQRIRIRTAWDGDDGPHSGRQDRAPRDRRDQPPEFGPQHRFAQRREYRTGAGSKPPGAMRTEQRVQEDRGQIGPQQACARSR